MKTPLVLAQLALVVSVVAFLMILSEKSPSTIPEPLSLESSLDEERLNELDSQIEKLTRENQYLQERIEALESRAGSARRSALAESSGSEEELEALRAEVRAELDRRGESLAQGASDPSNFSERVSEALEELGVTKARENARRGAEKRTARLSEKLTEVAEQLGLNGTQEGALESSLTTLYSTQSNYRVMWETGQVTEKEDFAEIMQGDMDLFLTEISGFLSPQQYEGYVNLEGGDLFPDGTSGK